VEYPNGSSKEGSGEEAGSKTSSKTSSKEGAGKEEVKSFSLLYQLLLNPAFLQIHQ
jgi:hypothetical protein